MKYLNKKIVLIVIIILLLSFFAFLNNKKNKNNIPFYNKEGKSNRDIAIKEVIENPDRLLRRTQINGEIYVLTGYERSHSVNNSNENKPGWKFGGLIVFKLENNKPIFFWESSEIINTGEIGGFKDINNDSIPEIVWEYDLGVTGRNNSFYVYKFIGNGFKLVTPIDTSYNMTLLSGDSGLTYIKDIDNDGVQEIIVGNERNISGDINNPVYERYQQIYKYDGEKYYLYKEEKIGEEKPEPKL